VFGSAVAYGLFFYFAAQGNLTSLSALTFLTPVVALIFGNLFLSESLTLVQFAGVAVTLVSVVLINQREAIAARFQPMLLDSTEVVESIGAGVSAKISESEDA
jgi:drug/metabolite transporter (DMT)-like permease